MSAAGREMGLTPAVVSKRISQLEHRLGARLFQRTTRQLTLTETGSGYFRRVVDILSLYEEAEDFISRGNTSHSGLLKVSVPTTFSRLHIAPHLHEFFARYPGIRLDLQVGDAHVDIVREGFDLAIRIGELPDSSLVAKRIAPDSRAICATRSYLQNNGEPRTLAELESHNCLTVDTVEVWRLHTPGGEVQFRPRGNVRCNSSDIVRELVIAGTGIGMLSTWDVGPALRDGSLRAILPEHRGTPDCAVHAVYPTREFMPAKVQALIDFLAQLYGPKPYWEKGLDIEHAKRSAEPVTRAASSAVAQRSQRTERPLERRQI